jgi:hypothetical protein
MAPSGQGEQDAKQDEGEESFEHETDVTVATGLHFYQGGRRGGSSLIRSMKAAQAYQLRVLLLFRDGISPSLSAFS